MGDPIALEKVSPQPDIPPSVVKSAGRALQILEFFDAVQREACVSEISRALHYPQSSTSVLLRSLVSMGYLQHDRYRRTYFPTRRVSLLGNWVDPALIQQGSLLEQADELARVTKQTVVMATANGLHAQYIYVNRASTIPAVNAPVGIGTLRPIAGTAVGKALLSSFDDNHVSKLIRRINAERREDEPAINITDFLAELRMSRKRGFFAGPGAGNGQFGVAITVDRERQLLVMGIEADGVLPEGGLDGFATILKSVVASLAPQRMLMTA